MRRLGAILIAAAVLTVLVGAVSPALAATYTEVQTFVNSLGNTVTVESTYVDGVLTTRTSTETRPDGTVVLSRSWDFYPSGAVQTYEESRYFSTSVTHIIRNFSESGVLLFQRAELSLGGELSVVSLATYDAAGFLVTYEERRLTTLADGTKVWEVTVSTYSGGVLVGTTVTQYPYGYVFDAPPAGEEPPSEEPPSEDPGANTRPGWGHGDKNHVHTGPPGNGSANGAAVSDTDDRPGVGKGDKNHDHQGAPGQQK